MLKDQLLLFFQHLNAPHHPRFERHENLCLRAASAERREPRHLSREIFALLGPNGAGKTTLIGIICGTVNASGGTVTVDSYDNVKDYRHARAKIGLVPQELTTDTFETVWSTVSFSRGLFGKPPNPAHIRRC